MATNERIRRVGAVLCTSLVLLSSCARSDAREIVLDPDPQVQARVRNLFGRTQGAVIVYDMPARRVLAVTNPTIAFRSLRPPGSLMKLVTAVALLRRQAVTAGERFECTDRFQLAGRTFTCGVQGGHGVVDLRAAIAKSCNIYFYARGQRLRAEHLLAAARQLGMGQPSPFAAGLAAIVSAPRSQRDLALAMVGEGGSVRMTPWDAITLVARLHEARDEAGRFVYGAMREVVTAGTGQSASVPDLDVRGKTGTATWSGRARPDAPPRTHGWFACTAGRLAIVVFLESGTGHDAANMAGRVLRACKERT